MASFSDEPLAQRPGSFTSNTNDVANFLGAAVKLAAQKLAHDHSAMARRLNWPLEMVNRNPAHALEMVRLDLARHAVVQHVTGQLAPRPGPPPARKSPPTAWDRAKTAAGQEFQREVFALTHPVEALANHIHDQRLTQGAERHLARANDLMGGGFAGAAANVGEGLGKAADFQRRYAQGQIVTDEVGKRFFGLPAPPSYADQAAQIVAPLRREAEQRPPRTFAGELAAGTPGMAVVMVPGIGPALLGLESLGAASNRARQTHAPDTPVNDAAMAATAAVDTAAGFLLKGRGGLDPARIIEAFPEAARTEALDLSAKVFARSASGAAIGGGQVAADNVIAKGSYDPQRRRGQGIAEGLLFGVATGAFAGRRRQPNSIPNAFEPPPRTQVRASTIQQNKMAGDAWETEGRELHVAPVHHTIQPQITLRSKGPSQRSTRMDTVAIHKESGQIGLIELKASQTAPLTKGQKIVFPELESHGGVVVGKGKPPYVGGTEIPPTKVTIIRKPQS